MADNKRPRCQQCLFLEAQCVCAFLPTVSSISLRIIVLQDPKEAKHAKNTVALLSLALPQVDCISMDDLASLEALQSLDLTKWRLIYPADLAVPIEGLDKQQVSAIEGIILIDGTWRKAKRFYLTQPWLHDLASLTFAAPPLPRYEIRKSPSDKALSSLEACCYAVEQLTGQNMQPINEFMVASIQWQWRHQPKSHKHTMPLTEEKK